MTAPTDDTAALAAALDRLAGQGVNGEALLLHTAHMALSAIRRFQQAAVGRAERDLAVVHIDAYWQLVDGDDGFMSWLADHGADDEASS